MGLLTHIILSNSHEDGFAAFDQFTDAAVFCLGPFKQRKTLS
jgi:hypothetical protein